MSIISTNHHLIGVQNGGSTSGAVRYDIEQNLTPEEQELARKNIGFDGALKEYSGGANIDITDYVVSVTGKKALMIEDRSMTANESTNAIEIGVRDEYVEGIAEQAVETVIDRKIEDSEIITTIFRDNSLSGNGTQGSPLGVASAFKVVTDSTLTGEGTNASPIGLANDYQYTSPSGTSYINNTNHTIEQSNSAIGKIVTKEWKPHGQAAITASNPWEGSSLGGQTPTVTEVGWTIWDNAIINSDAYIKLSCGQESMNVPLKTTDKYHSHYFPSATMPESWLGETVWETYYGPTTTQQITTYRHNGNESVTSGVRELAWKEDVDKIASQVATNTSNISTNIVNINSVTEKADNTWEYIQEHEAGWGASINAGHGISGTGSVTNPLGLTALKVSNTLSGDGVDTSIGLTASYALASDLQNTQQAVVSNTNAIGDLQQSYDSLNYTVEGHSDDLLTLSNSVNTCEQNIQVNSDNIDTISGDMVSFLEIGSHGQTAYRKKLFASATNMEGAQEHLYAESNASTHSTSDLGYTVTSAVAESLPKLGYVHDLQYYSNPNTYANNKNKIDYINCSDFDTAAWVEGAIMLTCSKPCSLTIMPLTGSPETLSDWNMQGKNINMPSVIAGHPVTIPFLWSNFDSPILAIGIKGSDNITRSDISYNHWHIHGKRGN